MNKMFRSSIGGEGSLTYEENVSFNHCWRRLDSETRYQEVEYQKMKIPPIQRAITTALWCNFLVFSLKFGVWWTSSSHVMMAEVVHSVAYFSNQALLAYGLSSSRRAPDALHPLYMMR